MMRSTLGHLPDFLSPAGRFAVPPAARFFRTLVLPACTIFALAGLLHAQTVSVNFFLVDDGGFDSDKEQIEGGETYGMSDYNGEGTSTVVSTWNNILTTTSGPTPSTATQDSAGQGSGVSLTVAATGKSWGAQNNDTPGMVGVPAWNMSSVNNALQLSGLQTFSPACDLILYLGYQNNSGFTGGTVTVGGTTIPVAAGQQEVVVRGLQDDTLSVSVANQTAGGIQFSGMFLGGFQLVAVEPVDVTDKPNVILIICDDLNTDVEGYGGHPQSQTPNIDRLMDSGHSFLQAHCTSPICAPSRASFLTGIYPHTSGNFGFERWYDNPVLANSHSIPSYFKANGYSTIGAGKVMHHYLGSQWDIFREKADYGPYASDGSIDPETGNLAKLAHPQTPAPFRDVGAIDGSYGPLIPIEGVDFGDGESYAWRTGAWDTDRPMDVTAVARDLTADEANTDWAVETLEDFVANPPNSPFFMAVGYMRPHTPLIADPKFFDLYPIAQLQLPQILDEDDLDTFFARVNPGESVGAELFRLLVESYGGNEELALKHFVQAYLACVASVDESIGEILDVIDSSPALRDNTIVVLTSDHGWHNGEKDLLHKNTLWEISTRVPFIIRAPGVTQAGAQSTHPVSQIDLFPTLIDLCDLTLDTRKSPAGAPLDGYSLRPFLEDPAATEWPGPDSALTARSRWGVTDKEQISYTLRDSDWRYIRYHTGDEELYRTAQDTFEWNNLAGDPAYAARKRALARELNERVGCAARTDLSKQILFWQDFEEEDGKLSEANAMGFTTPIQTAENGTANKGDLEVGALAGSKRLRSVSVNTRESAQFRLNVISGEPNWAFEFDASISDLGGNHSFRLSLFGGVTDVLEFHTTGSDNITWAPGDGSPALAATFGFSTNEAHHIELLCEGGQLNLSIDDQLVLGDFSGGSSRNNLGFILNNTAASPAPVLSVDNLLIVRSQAAILDWLIENGYAPTTDLNTVVNGRTLLEHYAFNGDPSGLRVLGGNSPPEIEYHGNADGVTYDVEYSFNLFHWYYLPPENYEPMDASGMVRLDYTMVQEDLSFFRILLGLE